MSLEKNPITDHYNDELFKDDLLYCPQLLKQLINGVVNMPDSRHKFLVDSLTFVVPETKRNSKVKKSIQDILVRIQTTDGEDILCCLELQTYTEGSQAFCVRIRHYDYNLSSRHKLKRGQKYRNAHLPSLLQIWLIQGDKEWFQKCRPDEYHFCIQGTDSRDGTFVRGLSQDLHYVNIDYFEAKAEDEGYIPQNDLEIIMMYFTCKTLNQCKSFVRKYQKNYLREVLDNEIMYFKEDKEPYMKFEEEIQARKAEKKRADKAEAEVKELKAEIADLKKQLAEQKAEKAKKAQKPRKPRKS